MDTIKSFFSGIKSQAHLLGGIYYLWMIVSGLAGAAYSAYKLLATPEISGLSEWIFYIFVLLVVGAMILLPLLAVSIFAKVTKAPVAIANPGLEIRSRHVEYKISKTGLLKRQKLTLFAIAPTNSFRMSIGLTGNGKAVLSPRSAGLNLLGPIARGSADAYELQFTSPMAENETRTIEFDIEVVDEKQTMRPFLTDHFHNAVSYGEFKANYLFEGVPTSVFSDRLSTAGESLGNMRLLIPRYVGSGAIYEVHVQKIDHHCSYTVSWVW